MIKFDCAERIGFHDSILTKIINFNNGIHLYLEDVYIDEVPYSMKVSLINVEVIKKNGVLIDKLEMETDDGEIYSLHEENSEIAFDVIWHKHSPNTNCQNA